MELFGRSIALPDFPTRQDIAGWGLSNAGYVDQFSGKLNCINTYYNREPRFDITEALDPKQAGCLDFLISTEVFEHIAPPVSIAFENARKLLKRNGVLVLSVLFAPLGETKEHFPELHKYEIIHHPGESPILKNITKDGWEQIFSDLVFHGGEGGTLEMRKFSQEGGVRELKQAGFGIAKFYPRLYWEFGVYFLYSFPQAARPALPEACFWAKM